MPMVSWNGALAGLAVLVLLYFWWTGAFSSSFAPMRERDDLGDDIRKLMHKMKRQQKVMWKDRQQIDTYGVESTDTW